jgi:hypothetical protein
MDRTGLIEYDSKVSTDWTQVLDQDCWERTVREDSQNSSARTLEPEHVRKDRVTMSKQQGCDI